MEETQEITIYEKHGVKLTNKNIVLAYYWFPTGNSQTIPLEKIQAIKIYKPRHWLYMKDWGMGLDFQVWWHLEWFRALHGRNAIVIEYGRYPKAGITPGHGSAEDVDLIAQHLYRLCPQLKQDESLELLNSNSNGDAFKED